MVYQGTVLGPAFWNTMFWMLLLQFGSIFLRSWFVADDLNAFRIYPNCIPNSEIFSKISNTQEELHAWGRANRIIFERLEESKHVISHIAADATSTNSANPKRHFYIFLSPTPLISTERN